MVGHLESCQLLHDKLRAQMSGCARSAQHPVLVCQLCWLHRAFVPPSVTSWCSALVADCSPDLAGGCRDKARLAASALLLSPVDDVAVARATTCCGRPSSTLYCLLGCCCDEQEVHSGVAAYGGCLTVRHLCWALSWLLYNMLGLLVWHMCQQQVRFLALLQVLTGWHMA